MDLSNTFKNKKVFVTGHTGFKGSWLCIWLELLGAKIKGYALKPQNPSLYKMIAGRLKHESVIADIRNAKRLENEVIGFKPDFIFHLAAQPLVRDSYLRPLETFDVNVMGTAYLLDVVRSLKNECHVIVVTTDKVYRNNENGKPFKEGDPLGGHDPYSASKAAAEIVSESYLLSYFHPDNFRSHRKSLSTARAGNVIGGGDYAADRIVPDMIRAWQAGKKLNIRNPHSVRPWQHVLEPLSGYLALAAAKKKNGAQGTAFNFGPANGDSLTVQQLADHALSAIGSSYIIKQEKSAVHEAGVLRLSNKKAHEELGWKPKWDSKKAINKTINWYKNAEATNAYDLCVNDIEEYI